ncbi:MAG: tetratricopeptide repeat protein [Bacteroidales bacterium]|nr:tetratricopeptide repeat protein [Bacteroidales bacterium]
MKKLHVFLALLLMATTVFSQTRNLRNADRELNRDRLDRAVESIRLAMKEPENQVNFNAWFTQAKIFTAVANSHSPEIRALEPNAVNIAFESFQRVFEMDQRDPLITIALYSASLGNLVSAAYNKGAELFSASDFTGAMRAFQVSVNASALIDVVDTTAIFNVALCATNAGDVATAKEFFQKLVDMRANLPAAYTSLAVIFRDKNDTVSAGRYADLAAELFPNDYSAMINAASIHLMLGNYERASQILAIMSEEFSDNALVFFAKGVAFDQIGMTEEAEQSYLRAIELNPDLFEAIFNLAAHYVTRGMVIRAEANEVPMNEQRRYDELTELANETFRKAIPMLEKASEMDPGNIPVMSALRDIYVHLRMMDRATEITAQIEALQGR